MEEVSNAAALYGNISDVKQVAELQSLLGSLLPFSVPIDTNITNVKSIRKVGFTQGSSQADLKVVSLLLLPLCNDLLSVPLGNPIFFVGNKK